MKRISVIIICALSAFLAGCENDLQDVEQISSKKSAVQVDRSTGVEIIYSDSAIVKAKLLTPELLHYQTDKPYYEMKKGVTIIFLDENQQESSRVTADYAIRRENEKRVELKGNVVATNKMGETFKSDELIWDENLRRFYSDKVVTISTKTDTFYGTSFWANENFSYYEMTQTTGNMNLQKQGF